MGDLPYIGGTFSTKAWKEKREEIIAERGFNCEVCRFPLEKGVGGNTLHHQDSDSTNNSNDNLLLTCHSCHGLTALWYRYFRIFYPRNLKRSITLARLWRAKDKKLQESGFGLRLRNILLFRYPTTSEERIAKAIRRLARKMKRYQRVLRFGVCWPSRYRRRIKRGVGPYTGKFLVLATRRPERTLPAPREV